ncbi:hypothetical protein FPOAC1_004538 [Fusarium poae]|jgi:hypothetical protein|uniref:hypothetical protein n=1 Tax=Fusarium poae TaxID=36050 RepID=UPI001CE8DBB9|nr:hypothetical protein FPOAC1_004538 [Fusarium poae]KAG8671294.1 hypothetical protein FPOAC1_004538 [Fusarium poae]
MPYELTGTHSTLAIITHWEPLAADQSLSKQQRESQGPVRIYAAVYGRGKNGLISNKLAERLRIVDDTQPTKVPPVVWISWTFEGSDENLETSQVHVVPGLQQDLVLGDDTDELWQSVHISPPEEPLPRELNSREDFERNGISTVNERSRAKLKYLISLYSPKTQPNIADPNIADSEPEEIQRPSEVSSESLHSSTLDSISNTGSGADCWVMDFGNSIQDASSPQVSYLDTPDQTCGAYYNAAAHLDRTHSEPRHKDYDGGCSGSGISPLGSAPCTLRSYSPISNWSFIEKDSGAMGEQDVHQCQHSDFETHPGHRFWIWDRQRQLWRRRGRGGLDERDWFTESFPQ